MRTVRHATINTVLGGAARLIPVVVAMLTMGLCGLEPLLAAERGRASEVKQPTTAPAQTAPAGPAPKFRCDEPVYTFPETWAEPNKKIQHTFIVHNDGDAPLEILKVKPTCGCTVTKDYDKVISPGMQGKLPFVLSVGRYRDTITKSISVETNDPTQKRVVLKLTGSVKEYVSVTPRPYAQWGALKKDTPRTKTFKIVNNTDTPMKLDEVQSNSRIKETFIGSVEEVKAGQEYVVTVTAEGPFRDGYNSQQLRYNTGLEKQPQITIFCTLQKLLPVSISPTMLRVRGEPAREYQGHISVTYNEEGELKLLSAEASDPQITTKITEAKPGKAYRVTVTMPQGYNLPKNRTPRIEIKTDYEKQPTFTVPILPSLTRRPAPRATSGIQAEQLIGRAAPVVNLSTADGDPIQLGGRGPVTVLTFGASWSSESHQHFALLKELAAIYRRKGVQFLNVFADQLTPPSQIVKLSKALDVKLPIALDPLHSAVSRYGITHVPTLMLLGKNGTIEAVHNGAPQNPAHQTDLAKVLGVQLDVLLAGKTRKDFSPTKMTQGRVTPITATRPPITATRPPITATRPTSGGSAGPAIMVESTRQYCGQQKPGQKIEYDIHYRNNGKQPLEIRSVTASADVEIDPGYAKKLLPGGNGAVRCRLTTATEPRLFMHQVTLATNDPTQPTVPIVLYGKSRPYVEVAPVSGVDFSDNPRIHSTPRIGTLTYNGKGTIKYEEPESSSPKFEARLKPSAHPTYTMVIVKAKPPFDPGENRGVIRIKTNCKQQPVVEVPARLFMPVQAKGMSSGPASAPSP